MMQDFREKIKKNFGQQVKRYRLQRKMTQEKLAELTGLHRTYISDIERGFRNISLENIAIIAFALNTSISDLMRGLGHIVEGEENDND